MKENQAFKSIDALSLFFLVGLVIAAVWFTLRGEWRPNDEARVLRDANHLATQILAAGLRREPASSTRKVASLSEGEKKGLFGEKGTLSRDPWGQPYHYRFLIRDNSPMGVVVWSQGPNSESETDFEAFEKIALEESRPLSARQLLRGDDIGVIRWSRR